MISFKTPLDVFWHTHNPTALNKQGVDTETHYKSVIFYHEDYHKNYYKNNPDATYCKVVIEPKLEKFWKKYKNLTK